MRKLAIALLVLLLAMGLWAQAPAPPDDSAQLRQELEQMKKTIAALEQRLAAQEKVQQNAVVPAKDTVSIADLQAELKDVKEQVNETQGRTLLDRIQWSGDYRFQAHTLRANIPAHFDGMQLQSYMVKAMWLAAPVSMGGPQGMPWGVNGLTKDQMMGTLGTTMPGDFANMINGLLATQNGNYQYFANNLNYAQLSKMIGQFSPAEQKMFQQYLLAIPGTNGLPLLYRPQVNANNDILYTNRLRLNFHSRVADNITFGGRLSMYKVFGDSTVAQVFNGQPNTLSIDGTTARVPTGDMLRVERAFFSWNNIGGSKLYLSIGRRPSTDGPPLNLREDEPRAGTPSGSLFDYQYDGITVGYHLGEKTTARVCYGVGYMSGFGNGNVLKAPADRLKDVHLLGGMVDLLETDKTFIQALVARAWNVTDGFNGEMVLPNNPVTGDSINAPVVLRFTPSANLGAINLYALNLQRKFGQFDLFFSGNMNSLRPNGLSSPFGGLGSDPFETPSEHNGTMVYVGLRYSIPQNDGKTKIGFEFNHGSKYWFNFSQAEDDIFMPKTATRGDVYETYVTHRINDHFIFKADYQRLNYTWSGSGWHLGAPKRLSSTPVLGFPTYDTGNLFTLGLTARF